MFYCPAAGAANEGVLASFFNSLLSKKTGSPGSPGSGAVGAGVQGSAKKTGNIFYFCPPHEHRLHDVTLSSFQAEQ